MGNFYLGCFTLLVVATRLTSRGDNLAMNQLVAEATSRSRQKIARQYLQRTAQNDENWQRADEVDGGKDR